MPNNTSELYEMVSDKGYFKDESEFNTFVSESGTSDVFDMISGDGYFKDKDEFDSYFDVKKKEESQILSEESEQLGGSTEISEEEPIDFQRLTQESLNEANSNQAVSDNTSVEKPVSLSEGSFTNTEVYNPDSENTDNVDTDTYYNDLVRGKIPVEKRISNIQPEDKEETSMVGASEYSPVELSPEYLNLDNAQLEELATQRKLEDASDIKDGVDKDGNEVWIYGEANFPKKDFARFINRKGDAIIKRIEKSPEERGSLMNYATHTNQHLTEFVNPLLSTTLEIARGTVNGVSEILGLGSLPDSNDPDYDPDFTKDASAWMIKRLNEGVRYSKFQRESNPLPDKGVGAVVDHVLHAVPLIITLAATKGKGSPRLLNKPTNLLKITGKQLTNPMIVAMAASSGAGKFVEERDKGADEIESLTAGIETGLEEGAVGGITLLGQMGLAGRLTKGMVSKYVSTTGGISTLTEKLIHANNVGSVFGGTSVARDVMNGNDVDWNNAGMEFMVGVAFEMPQLMATAGTAARTSINNQLGTHRLNKKIQNIVNYDNVINNVENSNLDIINEVNSMDITHQEAMSKSIDAIVKARESKDLHEKQAYFVEGMSYRKISDIKFGVENIIKNKDSFIESIDKSDISETRKEIFKKKVEDIFEKNTQTEISKRLTNNEIKGLDIKEGRLKEKVAKSVEPIERIEAEEKLVELQAEKAVKETTLRELIKSPKEIKEDFIKDQKSKEVPKEKEISDEELDLAVEEGTIGENIGSKVFLNGEAGNLVKSEGGVIELHTADKIIELGIEKDIAEQLLFSQNLSKTSPLKTRLVGKNKANIDGETHTIIEIKESKGGKVVTTKDSKGLQRRFTGDKAQEIALESKLAEGILKEEGLKSDDAIIDVFDNIIKDSNLFELTKQFNDITTVFGKTTANMAARIAKSVYEKGNKLNEIVRLNKSVKAARDHFVANGIDIKESEITELIESKLKEEGLLSNTPKEPITESVNEETKEVLSKSTKSKNKPVTVESETTGLPPVEKVKQGFIEFAEAKKTEIKELRESFSKRQSELKLEGKTNLRAEKDFRKGLRNVLNEVMPKSGETKNSLAKQISDVTEKGANKLIGKIVSEINKKAEKIAYKEVSDRVFKSIKTKTSKTVNGKKTGKNVSFEGAAYIKTLNNVLPRLIAKDGFNKSISNSRFSELLESKLEIIDELNTESSPSKIEKLKRSLESNKKETDKFRGKREEFIASLVESRVKATEKTHSNSDIAKEEGFYELEALKDIENILNADISELNNIADNIDHTINSSKRELAVKVENQVQEIKEHVDPIIESVRVEGSSRTEQEKINQEKLGAIDSFAKKALASGSKLLRAANLSSLNALSSLIDVKSNKFEGVIHKKMVGGINEARDIESASKERVYNELNSKVSEIYKRSKVLEWFGVYDAFAKISGKENKFKFVDSGIEVVNSEGVKEINMMSKDSAMSVYAWSKNKDVRFKLKEDGWSEKSFEQLDKFLSKEDKSMVDWVVDEFIPKLGDRYNQTYLDIFNTTFGKIPKYFPITYDAIDIQRNAQTKNQFNMSFSTPSNTKARTRNSKRLDTKNSFFNTINRYIDSMENFDAYAKYERNAVALLANSKFKNNLEAQSKGLYDSYKGAVERTLGKNIEPTKDLKFVEKLFNAAETNLALSAITFKNFSGAKQILSYPAVYSSVADWKTDGGTSIRLMAYAEATARLATTNPYKAHKWLVKNNRTYKDRVEGASFGEESVDAFLSRKSSKGRLLSKGRIWDLRTNAVLAGTLPTRFYDAITVAQTSRVLYKQNVNAYLKSGKFKTKELAEKQAMDDVTNFISSQQSSKKVDLTEIQSAKGIRSAYVRFQNAPIRYFQKSFGSLVNISQRYSRLKKKGLDKHKAAFELIKDKETSRDIERYFIYAHLLPAAWAWVSSGMPGVASDWTEEDTRTIGRRTALGLFDGVFLVGNALKSFDYVSGSDAPEFTKYIAPIAGQVPAMSILNKDLGELAAISSDIKGGWNYEATKMIFMIGLKTSTSINYDSFDKIQSGVEDLINRGEATEENILTIMNAPDSVIEKISGKSKKKGSKSKTSLGSGEQ